LILCNSLNLILRAISLTTCLCDFEFDVVDGTDEYPVADRFDVADDLEFDVVDGTDEYPVADRFDVADDLEFDGIDEYPDILA
jgi:hypothetical protein